MDKIFAAIIKFKTENDGNSPSLKQLGEMVGLASKSTVHYHLRNLEQQGKIKLLDGKAKSIIVKGGKWTYEPETVQDTGSD